MQQNYSQSRTRRNGALAFLFGIIVVVALVILGIEFLGRPTIDQPSPSGWDGNEESGKGRGEFPRTVLDSAGRELRIEAPPRRIVSQTLGTDEILLSICPSDRIVAVSALALDPNYSNIVHAVQSLSLQQVEGVEQILRLEPDLIFVASYSRAEFIELLSAAGAPIFRFSSFNRIEDIKSNIRTVGYAIGEERRAEEQIRLMEHRIDAACTKIPPNTPPPRVMSYTAPGFTAGANTLFDDIARTVGAINVSAEKGVEGVRRIDAEQITAWEPDYLVAGAREDGFESIRTRLLSSPAIAASAAGRSGRIILIDNRPFMSVSHHIAGAVEALVDALFCAEPEEPK
jgi:iron complex transport system substrate-binding protein